jgi:mannitol 2-dehydrogenase
VSVEIPLVRLRSDNLKALGTKVQIPRYDRSQLQAHTVHIGVGGFHRAHQAVYLDDLLEMNSSERWGECGIGVLAADLRMRDALVGQDYLYAVVERSATAQNARVIGSLIDYVYAPAAREGAIERMAAPETRIVSLTITEGGYYVHEGTGEFLIDHPDIEYDFQHSHEPRSSIGLIAEALRRRRARGLTPFTVMSCDNLQSNGRVACKILLAYAGQIDQGLERWIAQNVAFPNSMVDRITPATTPADIAVLAEQFGIQDAWPVVTEPFRQWVIEDTFCNGRPAWEKVGAQFSSDVGAYELMKIRLLNGSHLAMGYLAALHGYTYVHETMQDPLFRSFIEAFMEEVTPVVPRIAGVSLPEYKSSLIERFSNPTINDQVTRICSEGSAKIPKWLLPSIMDLLRAGMSIDLLSLIVASWMFYMGREVDQEGNRLTIIDARAGELATIARAIGTDPRPFLAVRSIFGDELPSNPSFVKGVENSLQTLATKSVPGVIRMSLSGQSTR